jgi:hypothetical protein
VKATVTRTQLEGLREFITELSHRVRYTRIEVAPDQFPLWCAALGADHFYTWTSQSGGRWTYINMASVHESLLTVEVNGPLDGIEGAAELVYPDRGKAGKSWQFTYEVEES